MYYPRMKHNPESVGKEINFLKRLGLRDDEIQYLIWIKNKNLARKKWD